MTPHLKHAVFAIILLILYMTTTISEARTTKHSQEKSADVRLELSCNQITSGVIDLDYLMCRARENSYELKRKEIERKIKSGESGIERSEYYPKINMYAGSEYTHNLRDSVNRTMTTVGEMFINPYTRYQTIMGITMSYNVFDFGVRRGRMEIAKKGEEIARIEEEEELREIEIKITDMFARIIMLKKEIETEKEIIELLKSAQNINRRLNKAGEIRQSEVDKTGHEILNRQENLLDLQQELAEVFENLSYYTGELRTEEENIKEDFGEEISSVEEKPVIWQLYEKQIKRKELEIGVLKRSRYPKVTAYGRYYMYGMDGSSYGSSLGDISPSNYTVGGSISMPIFDGMRNREEIKKAEIEKLALELERDRAMKEYNVRVRKLHSNLDYTEARIQNRENLIKELENKKATQERMLKQGLEAPIGINETTREILEKRKELINAQITKGAIKKTLAILAAGDIENNTAERQAKR